MNPAIYVKAIVALISSGGLTAAGLELGLSMEVMVPVIAAVTAILTWLVPNAKATKNAKNW